MGPRLSAWCSKLGDGTKGLHGVSKSLSYSYHEMFPRQFQLLWNCYWLAMYISGKSAVYTCMISTPLLVSLFSQFNHTMTTDFRKTQLTEPV